MTLSAFTAANMQQNCFEESWSLSAVCRRVSEMRGTLSWRTTWVIYGSRWLVHQDSACQGGINKLHQLYCMWMKYWNETNKQEHKSAAQIYTAEWTVTLTADVFVNWEPSELMEGVVGVEVEVHVSCSFCFRPPLQVSFISNCVLILFSLRSLQRQQHVTFSSLWAPPQRFEWTQSHGWPLTSPDLLLLISAALCLSGLPQLHCNESPVISSRISAYKLRAEHNQGLTCRASLFLISFTSMIVLWITEKQHL